MHKAPIFPSAAKNKGGKGERVKTKKWKTDTVGEILVLRG